MFNCLPFAADEVWCDLCNEYQLKLIIADDVIPDHFQDFIKYVCASI